MIFQIPIKTVSEANRASHEHWRVRQKRAKAQRLAAAMWSKQWRGHVSLLPSGPKRIKLTRVYGKPGRRLDTCNNPMSMKHVQDGLCDALGIDDGDESIEWIYAQRAGDEWCVEVEIT